MDKVLEAALRRKAPHFVVKNRDVLTSRNCSPSPYRLGGFAAEELIKVLFLCEYCPGRMKDVEQGSYTRRG